MKVIWKTNLQLLWSCMLFFLSWVTTVYFQFLNGHYLFCIESFYVLTVYSINHHYSGSEPTVLLYSTVYWNTSTLPTVLLYVVYWCFLPHPATRTFLTERCSSLWKHEILAWHMHRASSRRKKAALTNKKCRKMAMLRHMLYMGKQRYCFFLIFPLNILINQFNLKATIYVHC